ncbi:MAG: AMP-binding protein [Alphaproteobacteria bacterium]|jgi:acyl-CoA synthetase (AMP-forming)/AMP-acid ligase II|nr:AMP-binding protein [Alphaproteobacteria bacterium]MDP6566756.1 AMP-binding protein [Alphaproteobacteria bacterium]MDP6812965.1 AMP-binding protein [Alphaproteobacteria bacterium]
MHPGIHAAENPDKPAYIMANSGQVVSYGQLNAASNRGAHLFRSLGLGLGDSIAIFMENNAEYLQICWAAHRAGLYYTCISSYLTAEEVDYIVADCAAKVFITSFDKAEAAAELAALMPGVHTRLMVGGAIDGYQAYEEVIATRPEGPIADEYEGADMLYSSGTTGRPKGIKIPIEGEPLGTPLRMSGLLGDVYGIDAETIYLSPAPLYHSAPLRFNMGMLRNGATSIVMERFDPEAALQLIERYRVSHSQWVPTMFVRFLKLPAEVRGKYDLSSLRVAIHAAAPCPVQVKQEMIDWWGPVLFEYYAGTEGNGFCSINSKEWLAHRGSVGRALVGELHILDDDGQALPPGQPGAIYFSDGPDFVYHNDPEKTAESHNADGWSTLGDVGYLDQEGYLYLTDRKAFMIISGGVNIYPQEVENLLVSHPKVIDVAVVGVPHPEFGEEVKAVVQPVDPAHAGPALENEILDYCREHLSHVKCPRSVDFEAELPRHDNGKLYKRLIKDRYWGRHDTRIV